MPLYRPAQRHAAPGHDPAVLRPNAASVGGEPASVATSTPERGRKKSAHALLFWGVSAEPAPLVSGPPLHVRMLTDVHSDEC